MKIHKAALSGLLPYEKCPQSYSMYFAYFEMKLQVMCHYLYVFMKYVIRFGLISQFLYEHHAIGSHPTFTMATVYKFTRWEQHYHHCILNPKICLAIDF
jgi:hypothetical protein